MELASPLEGCACGVPVGTCIGTRVRLIDGQSTSTGRLADVEAARVAEGTIEKCQMGLQLEGRVGEKQIYPWDRVGAESEERCGGPGRNEGGQR